VLKVSNKVFNVNIKDAFVKLKRARSINNSNRRFLVTIILFRFKNKNIATK